MRLGDSEYEEAVRLSLVKLREVANEDPNTSAAYMTYKELSQYLASHGLDVPYHGGLMPSVLADASRHENAEGRGLISALVVQQGVGRPSDGFYKFARDEFGRSGDDEALWIAECRLVRDGNAVAR